MERIETNYGYNLVMRAADRAPVPLTQSSVTLMPSNAWSKEISAQYGDGTSFIQLKGK